MKKNFKLTMKLFDDVAKRDAWAAEIKKLNLPTLAEEIALNAWKEQKNNHICLHVRSEQYYLNSLNTQKILEIALTTLYGISIKLSIIEDNNLSVRTPFEWQQIIYEEKRDQAYKEIIDDNNIQILKRFFDADLDKESIQLVIWS